MECHLAGRKYYDADEVWDKLTVGTSLKLIWDKDNKHDEDAVAVIYTDKDSKDDYHLGYIPSSDNSTIASFLQMGWDDVFDCRICKLDAKAYSENQIHLKIRINKKQ